MTCETCNGTHKIQKAWEKDYFGHDHYTRPEREVAPCPDCRRCTACGIFVDENPMQPLHGWLPAAWWCMGECFSNWLFAQVEGGNVNLYHALVLVLVVRDVCSDTPDPDPGYALDAQLRLSEAVEQIEREIAQQARPKEGVA